MVYKRQIPLGGLVAVEQEKSRLSKGRERIEANRDRLSARLRDDAFLAKAPEEVVEREDALQNKGRGILVK